MNDHDRQIRIETLLTSLIVKVDNHLAHHFRYTIMAWTITMGLIITLLASRL